MNQVFLISPNGFNEIKKQLLIKSVPILMIAMLFGGGIAYFNTKDKEDFLSILPFMIPILLLSLGYGLFKGLKRQKMLFQSFQLTISENNILREQTNTPTINIPFTDIQSIVKGKKGGYSIKGKTTLETILIPAQIENQENLEVLFNQIKPIEQLTQPTFEERYRVPLVLLELVLMATIYISSNKILVGISGIVVSAFLVKSFLVILRNKNIDSKTKRSGYYLILVLASVVAVTIMKLSS